MNRDRLLTEEVIRGCWHDGPAKPTSPRQFGCELCKKCGSHRASVGYINFSTWNGLGTLWEQLRQRKYWGDFWTLLTQKYIFLDLGYTFSGGIAAWTLS